MSWTGCRSLSVAVAMSSLLAACQCQVQSTEPTPPPRPSGVPAQAIWAGGIDGGDFIVLSPATGDGIYLAKIYNDHSGDLEFSGKLRLKGSITVPIDVTDPKTYSDWDGESLSLRDGRTLTPVK